MGAHVFVVESLAAAAVGETLELHGVEAHHAASVLRVRAGERIEVVDGRGRRVTGDVVETSRDRVDYRVIDINDEPEPQPRIVVAQALAKSDRGERAVEMLTEVGADVILPWAAAHSIVRWDDDRARRGIDRWRSTAHAAAKQSRRARLPHVEGVHSTAQLESWIASAALALVLDEEAATPITEYDVPAVGDVVVIVGPEGGISDGERRTFAVAGAVPARLGPTVLRTSTAGAVSVALLLSRTPRWNSARMAP